LLARFDVDPEGIKESFEKRLTAQKTVYLMQCHPEIRRVLGFEYSLYLRGPYSPELAREYYELEKVEADGIELSDEANEYIREISSLGKSELELIATAALVKRYNRNATNDKIVRLVRELKRSYTDEEVKEAVEKLDNIVRKHGLDLYRQPS
jgi:uncharacterized protein YwgA